ncbi:MAG TPA: hypothetical protein VGD75_09075, partial [Bradyrhizobium sp.]
MSGVESGKAAPLVGGPPGVELHTVVEEMPSGTVGEMFPVVVPTIGVGIVPNTAVGAIAVGDIDGANAVIAAVVLGMDVDRVLMTVDGAGTGTAVIEGDGSGGSAGGCGAGTVEPGKSVMNEVAGCADSVRNGVAAPPAVDVEEVADIAGVVGAADIGGSAPVVPAVDEKELTGTAGVPGVICPAGAAHVTTVLGIVGSEASGTGANVVSGAGWVDAENGLGPLSGEDWIAPGVDGRPIAV